MNTSARGTNASSKQIIWLPSIFDSRRKVEPNLSHRISPGPEAKGHPKTMLSICVALKNRSRVVSQGRELRLFPNCVQSITRSLNDTIPAELVVADWDSDDWPLADW